jgi:mono/diheme cytochrome c family protein
MKKLGALSILITMLALAFAAQAQQTEIIAGGELEYQRNCVVCHGIDGRGDGIMRKYLNIPPANLRQLAKKNGGKFPFWEVYRKIDGQTDVRAHGTREMPIWAIAFVRRLGATESPQ